MCCFRSRRRTTRRAAARWPTRCRSAARSSQVTAPDPHTVVITFPTPFAPGHPHPRQPADPAAPQARSARSRPARSRRPGASTRRRRRSSASARSSCREYVPGPAARLRAQPALLRARRRTARALPYLDRLVVEIIPDQSAELLRLESGQLDMMTSEIAPEAYAPLKRAADQGRVKLLDLGVSRNADGLWFNLKPGALGRRPARRLAAARRAAPRDLDGRRSQAVRRHRVPRRRRAGLRSGDAGQQDLVLARPAADAARSGRGASSCSRRSA